MSLGPEVLYSNLPMADLEDLREQFGVHAVWIAVDQEGAVVREIGFAPDGRVVHRCPGSGPLGKYGIFDLAWFGPHALEPNLTKEEFDAAFLSG